MCICGSVGPWLGSGLGSVWLNSANCEWFFHCSGCFTVWAVQRSVEAVCGRGQLAWETHTSAFLQTRRQVCSVYLGIWSWKRGHAWVHPNPVSSQWAWWIAPLLLLAVFASISWLQAHNATVWVWEPHSNVFVGRGFTILSVRVQQTRWLTNSVTHSVYSVLIHKAAILGCELGVNKVSPSFRAEIPT